jgi:hypothetical protein
MASQPTPDDILLETLRLASEYGPTEAARMMDVSRTTYQSRLDRARAKFQSGAALKTDIDTRIAEGFRPKAYSHLTRTDTGELIWLKADAKKDDALAAFRVAVEDVAAKLSGLAAPTAPPTYSDDDLLTVVPMGDPHFGLLSWARETGEDFDLDIAERLTVNAVDRLASMTPPTGTALLLNLGDYFHADNSTNKTPRGGNELDVDGRFQKIASIGFRAMIRCIDRLKEKHAKVIVRNNRGNHDPHQAQMLTIALSAYYHDEPRVEVADSPSGFFFYRFGKVLIGSTDLPLIMANDAPDDWAAASFRVWHCGHFHHDQVKDLVGCTVETHRTLAAGDAWHRYQGYRAGRDMKAIVYHREFGEMSRVRCGVEMLEVA